MSLAASAEPGPGSGLHRPLRTAIWPQADVPQRGCFGAPPSPGSGRFGSPRGKRCAGLWPKTRQWVGLGALQRGPDPTVSSGCAAEPAGPSWSPTGPVLAQQRGHKRCHRAPRLRSPRKPPRRRPVHVASSSRAPPGGRSTSPARPRPSKHVILPAPKRAPAKKARERRPLGERRGARQPGGGISGQSCEDHGSGSSRRRAAWRPERGRGAPVGAAGRLREGRAGGADRRRGAAMEARGQPQSPAA